MSATLQPFGMNPVRHINGKFIPSPAAIPGGIASGYNANIFYGSPVMQNTAGNIIIATTAADILGVFAGCQFVPAAGGLLTPSKNWVANSTYVAGTMIAYVWSDPGIIYQIQANGSLASSALGDQADFVNPGNGNATTGESTAALSSTLAGAGVQAQLRIFSINFDIDNDWGDAFTKVGVTIARHQYIANKVAV